LNNLKSKTKPEIILELFSDTKKYNPLELDLSELKNLLRSNLKNKKLKMDKMTTQVFQKKSREKIKELNYAWIDRLKNPTSVLNEKMTLFWAKT